MQWEESGHSSAATFLEFGKRIGVVESRCKNFSLPFSKDKAPIDHKGVHLLFQRWVKDKFST